jgi:putative hydrolase of the HAD superfamily
MDVWLFDLDGTLYDDVPTRREFFELLTAYARDKQVPTDGCDEIEIMAATLKAKHGTGSSILAFQLEYGLDLDEVIAATVLRIDLERCGIDRADVQRRKALDSIDGRKIVFTNSPSGYAAKVLSYVGLDSCFERLVGLKELDNLTKPDPRDFAFVSSFCSEGDRIWFCDDNQDNLNVGWEMGWKTILFLPSYDGQEAVGRHMIIKSFSELGAIHSQESAARALPDR